MTLGHKSKSVLTLRGCVEFGIQDTAKSCEYFAMFRVN